MANFFNKTALSFPSSADQTALAKVTIAIGVFWESNTSQKVIFTISKKSGTDATSTVIVTRFKSSAQAQANINAARDILNKLVLTTTKTTKTATEITYADFADFITKTNFNFHIGDNLTALNKVTVIVLNIFVLRPFVNDNTSQRVSFKISKRGGKDSGSTIVVQGFKSSRDSSS